MNANRIIQAAKDWSSMMKGVVKMIVQSRKTDFTQNLIAHDAGSLIVMGNGPSLKPLLEDNSLADTDCRLLAVNFFANAPEFFTLKPSYYVMCDPHFFESKDDENVASLWRNLSSTDWSFSLFVPASRCSYVRSKVGGNVTVAAFNPVGVEGPEWFERISFGSRLAMPRPRNVLIPSIMIGLWLGYKKIYLAGADHSWMKTLRVSENNEVISVQPHFYDDGEKEHERVASVYRGVRLHEVINSFYVAFRSYFSIERYARSIGARIYNSTPGSFIDAFERKPLPRK